MSDTPKNSANNFPPNRWCNDEIAVHVECKQTLPREPLPEKVLKNSGPNVPEWPGSIPSFARNWSTRHFPDAGRAGRNRTACVRSGCPFLTSTVTFPNPAAIACCCWPTARWTLCRRDTRNAFAYKHPGLRAAQPGVFVGTRGGTWRCLPLLQVRRLGQPLQGQGGRRGHFRVVVPRGLGQSVPNGLSVGADQRQRLGGHPPHPGDPDRPACSAERETPTGPQARSHSGQ